MSEPITPRDWSELPADVLRTAQQALEAAVATITTELRGRTDTVEDLDSGPATAWRDHHLVRIAAATTLSTWLRQEISSEAYLAGHREDAPATYTDLGKAAGLTKEGARGRFAGAIPDAKPGRPRVRDPFPDLPLPDGVTVTGQVHRAFGRPYTDIGVPADLQTGDWVYIGEGSLGATPREVTGIENGGGGSWEIATADGDHTRVPAMKDTMVIRPSKTAP